MTRTKTSLRQHNVCMSRRAKARALSRLDHRASRIVSPVVCIHRLQKGRPRFTKIDWTCLLEMCRYRRLSYRDRMRSEWSCFILMFHQVKQFQKYTTSIRGQICAKRPFERCERRQSTICRSWDARCGSLSTYIALS